MSGEITGYRDLIVWQKSMILVEDIYRLTGNFPSVERFGLSSQIQRSAVSIPCNIAEGYGRGDGNYRRHVMIARGSLMELETQLEIAVRLDFASRDAVKPVWLLAQEVGKMLTKLSQAIR